MKKGDLRKQEMLDTAEALFCKKGYEQTSVQDILDQLKASKGSFYHHYPSKEALLEAICRRRADQVYEAAASTIPEGQGAAMTLNQLFTGMIPFRNERPVFLLMLLPTFRLPEGRMVKSAYCDALTDRFTPAVEQAIRKGKETKELFCGEAGATTDLCLSLVNRLWTILCEQIIQTAEKDTEPDPGEMLHLTETYRSALERILSLPYGCLDLVDLPLLKGLTEQIRARWEAV